MANLTGKTIGELISLSAVTDDTLFAVEYSGLTYNIPYSAISYNQPYKIYVALLSQDGTNAPVATVLENTLEGTPVWTRAGTGQYLCTLTGAFPKEKTFCTMTYGYDYGNQVVVYFGHSASSDYTYMYAFSLQGGAATDIMNGPIGNDLYVEIRVYP